MTLLAATSYPLLATFFTILWIAAFVLFVWLAAAVFADIFASHDISGWGKAGWVVLVLLLPLFGVLVYVIRRGRSIERHGLHLLTGREVNIA